MMPPQAALARPDLPVQAVKAVSDDWNNEEEKEDEGSPSGIGKERKKSERVSETSDWKNEEKEDKRE